MEIRLNRNEFLAELGPMQGIVERKTTIPVLSHLLLTARKDRLHLAATDLDVSLTSWCEADVQREGGIAVQAKKLMEIIRSLTVDEVLLVQEDTRQLSIRAGKSRFKIHGHPQDDFPTLPTVEGQSDDKDVEIPFGEFRRMVSKILFAVSAEESRFQLNGALLKLKGASALEMVATDGHRLALVEGSLDDGARDAKASDDAVLVPRKALQELQRIEGDGALVYRRGEHHLSFRLGRRELICRILEGTFPDYERVIAKDNDKKIIFDRKPLVDAVQRVALLTGDRARAVRLQFAPEQLTISAANPDLGEASEELTCAYDGPEFRLGINPDYLTQFLGAVETEKIRLELKDENTQCVGYPQDGPDTRYLCVIMPMRI
ncbi:MAG TPA: DNA polymerase III subunit beta [Thermoanaerobaculia bacterium]|jgi:DNA polymerase-3 subunit beta|nr:DNA polymerase III subunit beta [Thermoanaerobaculia bacterium]